MAGKVIAPAPERNGEEKIVTDELLRWRDEFPILEHTTYLISNSLGAMPRAVYERVHD